MNSRRSALRPIAGLVASLRQIAAGLAANAAAGYEELDCWVMPQDRDGLQQFGEVLKILAGNT